MEKKKMKNDRKKTNGGNIHQLRFEWFSTQALRTRILCICYTRTRMHAQHTYVNHIKGIQILLNIIAFGICVCVYVCDRVRWTRICCVRLLYNIILDELFNMIGVVLKNKYVPIIYLTHTHTHTITACTYITIDISLFIYLFIFFS